MDRALPRPLDWTILRPIALAVFFMVGAVSLYRIVTGGHGTDADIYWAAWQGEMYGSAWQQSDAYVYSPAFAQAIWPLTHLEWPVFLVGWTITQLVVLLLMAGPLLGAGLLIPFDPVHHEVRNGNIDLFIGMAIVAGFRWPATWTFVLLTKVTPGIGLLWFAARREWRSLAIALGLTAGVAAISFVMAPDLWADWARRLIASPDTTPHPAAIVLVPLPLAIRLLIAAGIIAWAAPRNQRWALVVACFVASPLPTIMRASMLVAIIPLLVWAPMQPGWLRRASPE